METDKDNRFDYFYEKHHRGVFLHSYKLLNDYHIAQDVTQYTFYKMYKILDALDDKAVSGYLYQTAYNASMDELRLGKRYVQVNDLDLLSSWEETYYPSHDKSIILQDETREMLAALNVNYFLS